MSKALSRNNTFGWQVGRVESGTKENFEMKRPGWEDPRLICLSGYSVPGRKHVGGSSKPLDFVYVFRPRFHVGDAINAFINISSLLFHTRRSTVIITRLH